MKWVEEIDAITIYWLIKYRLILCDFSFDEFLSFVDKGSAGSLLMYLVCGYKRSLSHIYELVKSKKCPYFKKSVKKDHYFNYPYNEEIEKIYGRVDKNNKK